VKRSSRDRRRPRFESPDGAADDDVRRLDATGVDLALAEEELGNNDLADTVVRLVERARPHTNTILAGLGVAVAALVAYAVVSSQAEANRKQGWDACMAALSSGNPEAFTEVLRRYPGSDAARWAELLVADAAAGEGAELLFIDRKRAEGRLQAAADAYSALMAGRPRGVLAERAVFGLAKVRESLGQLEEARKGYEAVAAEYPDDALAKIAASRAVELRREPTRQWYDWFSSQDITPPTPPAANPPAPGSNEAAPAAAAPSEPSREP
jgi:tetratricopeptide (TPR) repeat protein